MTNDSSSDDALVEVPDKTRDKYWKRKLELIKEFKELVGTVRSGKKKLNVLVLGTTGCGKSSFINTVLTSFREDKWNKFAIVGTTGGNITSVTQHFTSFRSDDKYYPEKPNLLFPTFIDINGLEDTHDEFNKTFLKLLLDGKIQEGEQITTLRDQFQKNQDAFKRSTMKRPAYLKIHRIIVVTSGDPDLALPMNLYTCIKKTSDEVKGIPIFGVMTKRDKFRKNQKSKQKQEDFIKSLGITKDSFKFVENYCPEVDQDLKYHRTVYPFIDVPVLLFMLQVINPKLNRDPTLDVDGYCLKLIISGVKFICTLFLLLLTIAVLFEGGKSVLCGQNVYYIHVHRSPMDIICNDIRREERLVFCFILIITFLLMRYIFPMFIRRLARASTPTWLIIISAVLIPIAVFIHRKTGN